MINHQIVTPDLTANFTSSELNRLTDFSFIGGAHVVTHPRRTELTDRQFTCLALVGVGTSYPLMAEEMLLSTNTIKTHVKNSYAASGIHRSGVVASLVQNGSFEIAKRGEPLDISDRELEVLQALSGSKGMHQAAESMKLKTLTLKAHLARMTERNGHGSQQRLIARAIFSGQLAVGPHIQKRSR